MLKRLFLYFIGCVAVFVDDESIAGATKTAFSLGLPVILGRRKKHGRRRTRAVKTELRSRS